MKTYNKTITEPRLVIKYDEDAESPRAFNDSVGYFITVDSEYKSPDDNKPLIGLVKDTGEEAKDQKDHIKRIKAGMKGWAEKVIAIYPVVKYEHSGVSYSLGTAHGFDYSNNGFYIVTDRTLNASGVTGDAMEKYIEAEIEIYNKWMNGEVYYYRLYDEDGELVDSCGGYYDLEDIKAALPEEWQGEKMEDYLI